MDITQHESNLDEAEFILKTLRSNGGQTHEQVIILVSTIMSWINTPKKIKKNYVQVKDDSDLEETRLREDESDREEDAKTKQLYYLDSDFNSRVPYPRYQSHKNLEQLALSVKKFNKNLRVHVLCAGIQYGHGE